MTSPSVCLARSVGLRLASVADPNMSLLISLFTVRLTSSRVASLLVCVSAVCMLFAVFSAPASANSVSTIAGNGKASYDPRRIQVPSASVSLSRPRAVRSTLEGDLFILDSGSQVVRHVEFAAPHLSSTVVGNRTRGFDGPDHADPLTVPLWQPKDITVAPNGDLYIADSGHHVVRRVDGVTKATTTIAGTGEGGWNGRNRDDARELELRNPSALALSPEDTVLFIADADNHVVRRLNLSTATVETIAGTHVGGFNGHNYPDANDVNLAAPEGLALSPDCDLYIADTGNHLVRVVDHITGTIRTVAGTGEAGLSGNGQHATSAKLRAPRGLTVAPNGDLYIADSGNHMIRRVDHVTSEIEAVAGTGVAGSNGRDHPDARSMRLNWPWGIELCADGLLVADSLNNVVRFLTSSRVLEGRGFL